MRRIAFFATLFLGLAVGIPSEPLSGRWHARNRTRLLELIRERGRQSPGYDPAHPPYAVFDWDNTCTFLDTEEATLAFQLMHARFGATADQMRAALTRGVPADPEVANLTADLLDSYGRDNDLDRRNFATKYRLLYQILEDRYGAKVAYPMLTYRFAGMRREEVQQLGRDAVAWQGTQPIESVTWTSPPERAGRAGVVSITWNNGWRLLPEMAQLRQELEENGIDVWICTASFADVIEGVSGRPERVIGMQLQRQDGKILVEEVPGYPMTYGPGKEEIIRRQLVPRYGHGPCLVAGDSNGDVPMLSDFPDTDVSLVIDAKRDPASPIGQLAARARRERALERPRFLVQERSETEGCFEP